MSKVRSILIYTLAFMLLVCSVVSVTFLTARANEEFTLVIDDGLSYQDDWPTSSFVTAIVPEGTPGTVWNIDKPDNCYNWDYVYVNGKSLRAWKEEDKSCFARISTVMRDGRRVIDLAVDTNTSPLSHQNVKTIEFRKGFRLYTPKNGGDLHSNDGWTQTQFNEAYVQAGELKETFILRDVNEKWERVLKQAPDANWQEGEFRTADDALTVTKLPDKTKYEQYVGVTDLTGIELTAKNQDGSTAVITDVQKMSVINDDYLQTGKQEIYVVYQGAKVAIEVEVTPYKGDEEIAVPSGYNFEVELEKEVGYYEDGCLVINFNRMLGQKKPKMLYGIENFGTNADSILINDVPVSKWKKTTSTGLEVTDGAEGVVKSVACYGDQIRIYMESSSNSNSVLNPVKVKTVEIKNTFQFPDFETDNWYGDVGWEENIENYYALPGGEIPFDITLKSNYFFEHPESSSYSRLLKQAKPTVNGISVNASDAVTVLSEPVKKEYQNGEPLDMTGMVLEVLYQDGGKEKIIVTEEMVTGFSNKIPGIIPLQISVNPYKIVYEGTEKSYSAGTIEYEISVTTKLVIDRVEAAPDCLPEKTEYNMGEDLDLAGIVFRMYFEDGTYENLSADASMVKSYYAYQTGEQTVVLEYAYRSGEENKVFTYEYQINVIDPNPDTYLEVNYASKYRSEDTKAEGYTIKFTLKGTMDSLYAIYHVEEEEFVGEYILLDGISVAERNRNGEKITVKFYGYTMWIEWDKDQYPDALGPADHHFQRIEFLPGLHWYTWTENNWKDTKPYYGARPPEGYMLIEDCPLKEHIILDNMNGEYWVRPFAEDDEALTIKTPAAQTVFQYGEEFNCDGLILSAKYLDGGTEDIVVETTMIEGYDPEKIGKQIITINYNDAYMSYEIEVKAPEGQIEDDEGTWQESQYDKWIDDYNWTEHEYQVLTGGGIAAICIGSAAAVAVIVFLTVFALKNKRKQK